jgi:predicted AlkP superfamily pyrophosphatase or phosphodiesterase
VKKVIFFMIDSLMPHVLDECISQGSVPALKFFKEHGKYWDECTTVFPTMTATVDCSLITGEYPDKHKIPALIWYEPKEKRLVNYTNGALPVIKLGLGTCANDVVYELNEEHLSKNVRSIYEELYDRGKTSGSINLIAHRSIHKYKVKLPFLLWLATGFCSLKDISGPEVFSLGTVSRSRIEPPLPWKWDESIFGHYGINDSFAIRFLTHLIHYNILPDFTMVYLPDNDHQVHIHPDKACQILSKVDKKLQKMLNRFPRWEDALDHYIFILTGDHGQTIIGESPDHNIHLEKILSGMKIAGYGESVKPDDEMVIANNERMTYVYPLKENVGSRAVDILSQDPRIDIVGWKEDNWVHVRSGSKEGDIKFTRNGPWVDVYGNNWHIEGNFDLLDIERTSHGSIQFGDYPDVLSRLFTALYSQDVPLIACSAKPGYEFKSAYAPTHLGGGSHGSLHKTDSTIPLIITGTSENYPFDSPRLIDLKNYILGLFT